MRSLGKPFNLVGLDVMDAAIRAKIVITASTDGDGDGGQHCQSTRHREFTPRQQVLVVHHCLLISGLVSGSVPRAKALHLCHLVVLLESEPI